MTAKLDPASFDTLIQVDGSGCWLWTGGRSGSGYGIFSGEYAHRLAFVRAHGPIPKGMFIDHKCRVKLCVNPEHLRLATPQQNAMNATAVARSSQFKGVSRYRRINKWYACIRFDGRTRALGYFDTESEAALAYDAAARESFGEFANLNFPAVV